MAGAEIENVKINSKNTRSRKCAMADFGYDEGVGASEASPHLVDADFPPQIAHFPPRIKNASADTPPRMSADSHFSDEGPLPRPR